MSLESINYARVESTTRDNTSIDKEINIEKLLSDNKLDYI